MEKLHHELWITHAVNVVFGPIAAAILRAFGRDVPVGAQVIPDYLAMLIVIAVALTALSLVVRSRLSVENPGTLQVALEDFITAFQGLLADFVGPKGPGYLPLVASIFVVILLSNLSGLVPGLMAPTTNLNVTLGCAVTVWVYYHLQGFKEQGVVAYLKHFAVPPGSPVIMAPLMLIIELIGHAARVLSLSLRLFGNIFGEELVIVILASLVPFIVPLPMMFLGLLTATLQALIFAILTMVYLGGAVAVEHHDEAHH
ncbi:MAG: F0F1 ATP synthase subunit A [Vicinamibacteria bacterium]|nr:F0F1 ATP synthase subunit A [Vicinamibacteria bacterium]